MNKKAINRGIIAGIVFFVCTLAFWFICFGVYMYLGRPKYLLFIIFFTIFAVLSSVMGYGVAGNSGRLILVSISILIVIFIASFFIFYFSLY